MSEAPNPLNAPPVSSEPRARWPGVAITLVLLLAGLLASFPARNSDVWRRLATGRAFLAGTYKFGADPFAYTTEGATWVNHSWLWDVVLFAIYQAGGERLVIVNALLAAGVAGFMLLAAGVSQRPWTAAFAVAVGLISFGPHLILAPTVVSYLLFAFTLWWLDRAHRAAEPDWSVRANLPLLCVFVTWANCDEWFLLGPLMVTPFWLTYRSRRLGVLFALSFAVCLLNPHHVQIFRVHAVWVPFDQAASGLASVLNLGPQISMPPIAYAGLIGCGVFCLWTHRSEELSPRTAACLALLGLSLFFTAAIPFFAIAASPLLADTCPTATVPRRLAWLAPLTATVALLALAAVACTGWLQGPLEPRGWHLHADPSLKRVAEQTALWHRQGQLDEHARGFNVSIDLAHYLEWYCPEEKVFIDSRANLFDDVVFAGFRQVRAALLAEPADAKAWAEARTSLHRWKVTHLHVADSSDRRLAASLRNLLLLPDEWSLIDVQGRATVFAWKAPGHREPLRLLPVDMQRRAFDPASASIAPRQGIRRDPQVRAWWDCVTWSADAGDTDEAIVDLVHFESQRPVYLDHNRKLWEMEAIAAVLGTIGPHDSGLAGCYPYALFASTRRPVPAGAATPLDILAFQVISAHMQSSDQGPPGSLLLAIRAARRAVHANPDDPLAHLRLGRAYERLSRHTTERGIAPGFPFLEQLRKVQALVALNRAVELRPDLLSAREMLANLLLEARGFDLALAHVEAHLRLSQSAGPGPNESPADFTARIEKMTDYARTLGKQVRELHNLVDTKSFKLDPHGKARLAESNGLPGYALEQLLRSNYAEFGREGAILQLYLLLHAGRTRDFRTMIDPAQEAAMGTLNYRWLQTLLAAADGNYDEADDHLSRLLITTYDLPDLGARKLQASQALGLLLGQQMLNGGSINPAQPILHAFALDPWQAPESRVVFMHRLDGVLRSSRQDAELHALRGLLALESGAIEPARRAFRASLAIWSGPEPSAVLARHYLRLMGPK